MAYQATFKRYELKYLLTRQEKQKCVEKYGRTYEAG